MPRVAVITPTYNRGNNGLLEKAMLSVLGQTYRDFVHIIVDDGSTDNTPDVVDRYVRSDSRVAYYRRERHDGQKFGASPARNYGIEKLDKFPDVEFVTFLDSDDLYARHNLERKVGVMEPGVRMVYSWIGMFKEMAPSRIFKCIDARSPPAMAKELKYKMTAGFPHLTVCLRRQLIEEVGKFDENIGCGEDRDFSIRMLSILKEGEMVMLPEVLYYYRLHEDGVCAFYARNNKVKNEIAYLSGKHGVPRTAAVIETAKRFVARPHSFLPEPVKQRLRPLRNSVASKRREFDMDPYVQQIEAQRRTA